MLSCFKITANRFKNSYKLVIIDSPWFPLILNFSLYAIIQDLTPTERNKYLIHFALDFQSDLLMALSSTKIHRFFLYFWNTHPQLFGRKSPIVIYKETTFKQVNFISKHKQRFLLVNLAAKSSQSNCYRHQLYDMDNYIVNTK